MAANELEKVLTALEGIGSGNVDLATRYINPNKYIEHNPRSGDGVAGLREYIRQLSKESHHLKVVRALQDEGYVFTQADGQILDLQTFFDIFRFEDGLIVEHWLFCAKAAPPNASGHTQIDGPTEAKHLEDTENNKLLVRNYYENFHIRGDHNQTDQYFNGNVMIRHEPGVRDGLAEFMRNVAVLMQHRTIDEIKLLLGKGDLVFIAASGTHEGCPCAYADLYRLENEKIVEHWGFPEEVPPRSEWQNSNGIL